MGRLPFTNTQQNAQDGDKKQNSTNTYGDNDDTWKLKTAKIITRERERDNNETYGICKMLETMWM